jgi:hypothetical protein
MLLTGAPQSGFCRTLAGGKCSCRAVCRPAWRCTQPNASNIGGLFTARRQTGVSATTIATNSALFTNPDGVGRLHHPCTRSTRQSTGLLRRHLLDITDLERLVARAALQSIPNRLDDQ